MILWLRIRVILCLVMSHTDDRKSSWVHFEGGTLLILHMKTTCHKECHSACENSYIINVNSPETSGLCYKLEVWRNAIQELCKF